MQTTFDQANPLNAGVDYQGVTAAGKPYKDQGKWCLLVTPDQVDSILATAKAVSVRSNGAATPCDVLTFVRQTSNGNYLFTRKLHPISDAVKAIREAADLQAKQDVKANGVPARQAPQSRLAPGTVIAQGATGPVTVTTGKPVTTTQTGFSSEEIASLQAMGFTVGQIAQMAQAKQVTASAPTKASKGTLVPGVKLAPKP